MIFNAESLKTGTRNDYPKHSSRRIRIGFCCPNRSRHTNALPIVLISKTDLDLSVLCVVSSGFRTCTSYLFDAFSVSHSFFRKRQTHKCVRTHTNGSELVSDVEIGPPETSRFIPTVPLLRIVVPGNSREHPFRPS